ncbi:MAG: lipid-A-disaccharide synthase [Candidatus Firestonebacteria bacterium]
MKILLSVGDASSDVYGAMLIKELKMLSPDIEIFANGGRLMENAGAILLHNLVDLSVVGFYEAAKNYLKLKRIIKETASIAAREKIDKAVLMDYPGFNLLLSAELKKLGIPVYYYVTPQVWAWGKSRIMTIRKNFDLVLPILPFEEKFFKEAGVNAEYFGNPLVGLVKSSKPKVELKKEFGLSADKKVIGLLPGSRKQEILSLLPVMLETIKKLPGCEFILGQAVSVSNEQLKDVEGIKIVKDRAHDVMAVSDCLIAASGTVALEAAIMGTPAVIIYKVAPLTWFIGKRLIGFKYISLPNIISGKLIYPELLQKEANPGKIASAVKTLLEDKERLSQMQQELLPIKASLGDGNSTAKVAKKILNGPKDHVNIKVERRSN